MSMPRVGWLATIEGSTGGEFPGGDHLLHITAGAHPDGRLRLSHLDGVLFDEGASVFFVDGLLVQEHPLLVRGAYSTGRR